MIEKKQPKRRPAGGGGGDGWRRWGAPAMMALFFLGFVAMRSANPCGPRACPISTPSILTGYEMPQLDFEERTPRLQPLDERVVDRKPPLAVRIVAWIRGGIQSFMKVEGNMPQSDVVPKGTAEP